ncbi:protoheme IX farnesyltransferase [Francisella tularensis]|uniref:Protoheme IX farnesyltransferase n=3 Tax=Francisella tularensis subsp. holarctica TaxID=119857 RepID=CYOE_FRATH|nr:heme o synthase [Francisella tularensis]Q2A5L1.1 RecName: Full=Protoheme IX farnesyltransferase; AltName: Full=Heme B farnesyltransferase; AltName: Full=Heme O synthase [Francisella tularensis subsp. holarctica LVS]EBA51943.1 protoheme IX farnesyltransferase [Francisella tularensis subsp. holarctica 257]AFT92186.1 protoheme IX farnesyltransferase [Francisella tularensis subsp. holarctica FSC200]AJI60122.1 protoheme IX farnesyltransferase [Francisella tularensis subsp. holarctica LVS]AYF3601
MYFKRYLQLAKPGIIFGNLITLTGGFLLATHREIGFEYLPLFVYVMIGVALMIAAGCVFNNIYDQDIDSSMTRTQNRPLVTGDISVIQATIYGTILLILSCLVLYYLVNLLTLWIIIIGFIVYVGIYTVSKRLTIHATVLGGISGAIPPVAGYTAVVNILDYNALALFLILFFWQIPHSYAIAMLYIDDYKKVKLPMLPIVKGIAYTKKIMLFYLALFVVSCALPAVLGSADLFSFIVCMLVALFWMYKSIQSYRTDTDRVFAKTVFKFSIIVITAICLTMG